MVSVTAPKKDKPGSSRIPKAVMVRKPSKSGSSSTRPRLYSCKDWTPTVSNQKRRGGQCTCFAFSDLVTTILRMTGVIGPDVFMSGQCLVDWGDRRISKVELFCCDPRFGFETTKDYPYEGVSRGLMEHWRKRKYEGVPEALVNDWSKCQSKDVTRFVIDYFTKFSGTVDIKEELESHFRDGPGYPCIALLNGKDLEGGGEGNHVVLIVGLDLRSGDENRHSCHIKNSWGKDWQQKGFDHISFDVIKSVLIPHYTPK